MTLKSEAAEAERRVEARRVELRARIAALRAGWRDRIDPQALLAVGAAVGFVLERVITYRSHKPKVVEVVEERRREKASKKRSSAMQRLLPLAQLAAVKWLDKRREDDQSPRSMSRADHSVTRKGNGLARH